MSEYSAPDEGDYDYDPNAEDDIQPNDAASQGFVASVVDEDPFDTELDLTPTAPRPTKIAPSDVSSSRKKKNKGGPGILKGKLLKILKEPNSNSLDSDTLPLDPEEEKMKMLQDCCEFTCQKNEGYEVDDTRKDMSSGWFSETLLTPSVRKRLCFAESLLIMEENGTVVGKMYCTVTPSKWGEKKCLCVHSGSFGKFYTGLESGTSITSFVDYKLKPLQEYVHEWATLNSETIERKTFLVQEPDRMPVKITTFRNGKVVDTKATNLGIREREGLVTEGTNILLLRLLIHERRTNGTMVLQSLAYTGKVVKAKYSELGSGWENVKGKQVKTWGIRRLVFIEEDEERQWDTLFNKQSRLILRCQPDSPHALIPLWFEAVVDFDKYGNFIGLTSPYAWACDAELYSKFVVKKEETTYEHRRYIMENPEVRALLSDYLQSLLFRKPQNVFEFTKQYFESFLHLRGKNVNPGAKNMAESSGVGGSSSFSSYSSGSTSTMVGVGEGEWSAETGGGEGRGESKRGNKQGQDPTEDDVTLNAVDQEVMPGNELDDDEYDN